MPFRIGVHGVMQRGLAFGLGLALALASGEVSVRGANWLRFGRTTSRGGFSAVFMGYHPRFGWLGIPGARVRHCTPENDCEVEINAFGLRDDRPPPLERTPGKRRIAVLGDSFVFGQSVAEEVRFTERLTELVPDLEVANLGLPGTGTGGELLLYRELEGPHRNADVVVLGYFLEHVVRNGAHSRHGRPKPWFELENGELALRGVPVPIEASDYRADDASRHPGLPIPFKTFLRRHSELYMLLRRAFAERLKRALGTDGEDPYPEYTTDAPAWRVTRALFAALAHDVEQNGARLAVMIIPEPWHLRPGAPDVHQRAVRAACAELDLPVLDLTPLFAAQTEAGGPRLYFANDGHWTAAGHALAAQALARFLADERLLPEH